MTYETFVCFFKKKKKNPFASCSSLFKAPPPPPPIPDERRFSVFIAYSDYTSLRLPYLFMSMEPTPNYTHQRWRLEEEEEEEEGGAGFGCSFKRHSASCCWEKRALGKQEGCLLSPRPALNDKRKCYPDMMGISKMAVQRMESVQGPIALPCENKHRRHHCADDISLESLKKHQPCDWSWEKKAPDIFILLQSQTQILIHRRLLILKVQVFCFSSVTHRHWSIAPFPIINS